MVGSLQERAKVLQEELTGYRAQYLQQAVTLRATEEQRQRLAARLRSSARTAQSLAHYRVLLRHLVVRVFVKEKRLERALRGTLSDMAAVAGTLAPFGSDYAPSHNVRPRACCHRAPRAAASHFAWRFALVLAALL